MIDYELRVAKRMAGEPTGFTVTERLSLIADSDTAALAQATEMRADGRASGDRAYLWAIGDDRFLGGFC